MVRFVIVLWNVNNISKGKQMKRTVLFDRNFGDAPPPETSMYEFSIWLDTVIGNAPPKHRKNVKMVIGIGERDDDNFPRSVEQIYYVKDK